MTGDIRGFFEDDEGLDVLRNLVDTVVGERMTQVEESIEALAAEVIGTRRTLLEGSGRHEDGLRYMVRNNSEALARIEKKVNGGSSLPKLSTPARWTAIGVIVTAVMGAIASIVVALIQVAGSVP